MQKQSGFTLVELVVVIIILGILAITAAPKFLNMQGDARVAALKGLKAGIEGSNVDVYGKAAIAGELDNPNFNMVVPGLSNLLGLTYGYLDASSTTFNNAMNVDIGFMNSDQVSENKDLKNDWIAFEGKNKTGLNSIKIWQQGAPQNCYLEYTESTKLGEVPTFSKLPSPSDC